MADKKRTKSKIEVYVLPTKKKEVKFYAKQSGFSTSAFFMMLYNDWKTKLPG